MGTSQPRRACPTLPLSSTGPLALGGVRVEVKGSKVQLAFLLESKSAHREIQPFSLD